MKNILFCFGFALAILLPALVTALDLTPAGETKIVKTEQQFLHGRVNNSILLFDDALLDISNDDDLNESERKKSAVGKSACTNTLFIAENFSGNYPKIISADRSFIPLPTSLFIFICQFRL